MDVDKAFADPDREVSGVWMDYRDGSRVKLARLGNPAFTRAFERRMQPHRRARREDRLSVDVQERIMAETVAETILLDWDGFERGGKPLKYSRENALDLLLKSRDFRDDVANMADAEERYHAELQEESEKNSSTASAGG